MRLVPFLIGIAMCCLPTRMLACSCFGPSTFCETLYPSYEPPIDPAWWTPHHIILGVKLGSVEYGVDLKVVQDFNGDLQQDQVIRVWGDCGLLCRLYNTGVADGDTVLWGIQACDLSGNGSCGMSVEQAGDFQLPGCGVYWLGYDSGVISGPLFTEGANETVSVAAFQDLVNGCLPTAVQERTSARARVWCNGPGITIETGAEWSEEKQACVTDAAGRVLVDVGYRGSRGSLPLPSTAGGLLLVRVSDGRSSFTTKLFAE